MNCQQPHLIHEDGAKLLALETLKQVRRTPELRIGTAGWSIPLQCATLFEGAGSHLERYSRVFHCAEINSSFHRPHRPSTYARWAASTPEHFRFSVKVPKTITHQSGLAPSPQVMQAFLTEARHLGPKLGPLLFQLPPSQQFAETQAATFLGMFRELVPMGPAVLEPRHVSWFSEEADHLLQRFHFGRVVADPPRAPGGKHAAGDLSLIYYRLHGSPRMYYSSYSEKWIDALAVAIAELREEPSPSSNRRSPDDALPDVWCVFDNTASGAATEDAVRLVKATGQRKAG